MISSPSDSHDAYLRSLHDFLRRKLFQHGFVVGRHEQRDNSGFQADANGVSSRLGPRRPSLRRIDEAFDLDNPPFLSALQVKVHLAVAGRKFRTDGAPAPDCVLQPEIQVEMPGGFRQVRVRASRLVFPRIQDRSFESFQVPLRRRNWERERTSGR